MAWERRLHGGGWGGISWPKEYGGAGLTLIEQAIFEEESARANAPEGINHIGRHRNAGSNRPDGAAQGDREPARE